MNSNKQRSDCVERSVMSALLKRSALTTFPSDFDIAKRQTSMGCYTEDIVLRDQYLLDSFLRKWTGLDTGIDLKHETFTSWRASEEQCFRTNRRIYDEMSTNTYSIPLDLISEAQRKISLVLGKLDFERNIVPLCRFGNGATFDLRHGNNIPNKVKSRLSISRRCIPWAIKSISGDEYIQYTTSSFDDLQPAESNRCVMVPKDAKVNRMISAEPTLNGFVQQGIGRFIRRRLKLFGVDLNDQTINQSLASRAQKEGLATIDLSSASDTLSISLVRLLLPSNWFELLDDVRSHKSSFEKKTYLLSKFSSMGNAFTFELETLIFWALTSSSVSTSESVVSVYGDDIICPQIDTPLVLIVLAWAGFSVNSAKSFTSGRFFESCGKHFFDGIDVTPIFQKEICTEPEHYIRLYNRLYRYHLRTGILFPEVLDIVCLAYKARFGLKPVFGPVVEGDRFFIDSSFDFGSKDRLRILCRMPTHVKRKHDPCDEYIMYGYKLRHASTSNMASNGHYENRRDGRYVFKNVSIWRSSLL